MARKHHHEEHANHEAWAIPYGDLVTLLLAFFVVMYAISSVNEGKYRVLADALSSAFGGPPHTISPIQLGETQLRGSSFDRPSMQTAAAKNGPASASPVNFVRIKQSLEMPTFGQSQQQAAARAKEKEVAMAREHQLNSLGRQIHDALSELVRQNLVTVRRGNNYLEVEIQSDILFASGAAEPSPVAMATLRKLSGVLRSEPNALRVEGYTDDQPISTPLFRSNWELSSARASSVVHAMIDEGIQPRRLAVVGYGEYQPIADNATESGRNANRRVLLVILAAPAGPDAITDSGPTIAFEAPAPQPAAPTGAADISGTQARAPYGAHTTTSTSTVIALPAQRGALHNVRAAVATDATTQPGAG
ncbi:flagellar motor protein MotD [Lysobacter terrae]